MQESAEADSPCTGLRRIGPETPFCDGCFRAVEETGAWSELDDTKRREILARIRRRRSAQFRC